MSLAPHDTAIWWTVRINDLIDAGHFEQAPRVAASFPPTLGTGERVLAEGLFTLSDFSAPGDGSYAVNNSVFFATGRTGLAMTAGHAVGKAIGNAARRSAARAAAVPRWRQIDRGQIFVSDHGFYLRTMVAHLTWGWHSVSSMELVGPGQVLMTGTSTNGPVRWILASDWAELVFTMWARARHSEHVQLVTGAWVPPGWAERVARSDVAPPPSLSGRWTPLMLPPGRG